MCAPTTFDHRERNAFAIGTEAYFKATRDGRLWCFANDVRFAYGNNSGAVERVVDRKYRVTDTKGRPLHPPLGTPSTVNSG